jgi:putative SOS response-associated peptidase YedK
MGNHAPTLQDGGRRRNVASMSGRFTTFFLTCIAIYRQRTGFALKKRASRLGEVAVVVQPTRWSLIRFIFQLRAKPSAYGAGDGCRLTTVHDRVDVAFKNAYRDPFKRRRCAAPANASFEWRDEYGDQIMCRFARADNFLIWLDRLWDIANSRCQGGARSFTMMAGSLKGYWAQYHNRAPLPLEPAAILAWLDPAQTAQALIRAARFEAVQA